MTSDNVIERINAARRIIAETDFIKSGTVTGGQKYSFIPIGQILQAVRKAHAQAGITVVFGSPEYDAEQFEKRYSYQKKGQYGDSTWFSANGHIHATIYGSSVDDRIEMDVPFEAQDNSDKLTNKIVTNAERCLYRVLYAIDEGDATDPEAFNYEMQDAPKQSARELAKNDPFLGAAPRTESDVTPPENTERTAAWAEKKADELRPDLIQFYQQNPKCAIVTERIKDHGQISDWRPGIVIQVHGDLRKEGLL
jgi:hypothetical protein